MAQTTDTSLIVKGRQAGSKEEYWFAMALEHFKLSYEYQYRMFGGRDRTGGQIIDFLVYAPPLPTPVYINGAYWHQDKTRNLLQQKRVSRVMKGQWADPLIVWDYQMPNEDQAMLIVRKKWVT